MLSLKWGLEMQTEHNYYAVEAKALLKCLSTGASEVSAHLYATLGWHSIYKTPKHRKMLTPTFPAEGKIDFDFFRPRIAAARR